MGVVARAAMPAFISLSQGNTPIVRLSHSFATLRSQALQSLASVEAQAAAIKEAAALRREMEELRAAEARERRVLEERESE